MFRKNYILGINLFLSLIIFFGFFLKFLLVLKHKIGWDEFYFLSKVHLYQRGELTEPFQNFHVHLLGWVPLISPNEITQIIAARCVLFILFIVSGFLLYKIARHFINQTGALVAVLCWISLSNVIQHGSSLRYDSFCSFFFLLACFALLRKNRQWLWSAIAGASMGISLLISIKAAIHVITLFVLLSAIFIISSEKKPIFQKGAIFTTLLLITFSTGFLVHKNMLPMPLTTMHENFVHHAGAKAIVYQQFFPQLGYFSLTLRNNPVTWWLLGVGVFFTILELIKTREGNGFIALAFLVPLLSLPFYRNAFPYYYNFIIAPAFLFCGILPQRILRDFQKTGSRALLLIFTIICVPIIVFAGGHFLKAFDQDNKSQVYLFDVIHKMFPKPAPYIDGCSAVASYPKSGFFMSTWGFEDYLATGQPVFHRILQEEQPRFLLANTPHLDFSFPKDHPFFKFNHDFFEEDRKVLEENYVPFWGMIYLPGKILHNTESNKKQEFKIIISGKYIIDCNHKVIIDGKSLYPKEEIILNRGKHLFESTAENQTTILRWNEIDYIPSYPAPKVSTFYGF